MNFICNREILQKYIIIADRITGKNLSLPILSSILIKTDKNKIIIRATNLEVGVEFQIPAEIKIEGMIALPGGLLSNILNSIPDEEKINISATEGICKILTKSKNITIKGYIPDDFPTIPVINEGETFTINSNTFIQGIKSVIMSAAISDIKPEISSVYIYQNGKSLTFVSTDSFRLAEKKISYSGDQVSQGIIIPAKNILEIVKVFEQSEGDILCRINKNQISLTSESIYITSRIIQGIYPDYEQIIPKSHTTELIILKQDLANSIKLSTFFSDKFNKIRVIINPDEKKCIFSTKNSEIGEIESNLTTNITGDPVEILLNGKHLNDCLSCIDRDSVVMEFNGFNKPVVIRGLGDQSFTYLTMPLTK